MAYDTGQPHTISGPKMYYLLAVASLLLLSGGLLVGFVLNGRGIAFSPGPFCWIGFVSRDPKLAVFLSVLVLAAAFFIAAGLMTKIAPDSDKLLLPAVFMLVSLGYLVSLRLFPEIADFRSGSAIGQYTWRHWYYILLGLPAMAIAAAAFTDNVIARLARRKYIYAFCAAGLIVATGLFGTEINGRKLWLPAGPLSFQTVEFVKILAVLFAAGYLAERRGFLVNHVSADGFNLAVLNRLGPFSVAAALCIMPVMIQKDFGPAFLLVLLMLLMYYLGAGRLVFAAAGLAAVIGAAWLFYHFQVISMVNTRLDMWLQPFARSEALARALWAAASGGLMGTGLGRGMSVYIPTVWSDFTFVVICEELGWAGAVSVIGLYALVVSRGFAIAMHQPDAYRALLAGGISGILAIQGLLIICGNLALLPLTGITLPFLSYGGSSLIITFAMMGILIKLSSV